MKATSVALSDEHVAQLLGPINLPASDRSAFIHAAQQRSLKVLQFRRELSDSQSEHRIAIHCEVRSVWWAKASGGTGKNHLPVAAWFAIALDLG